MRLPPPAISVEKICMLKKKDEKFLEKLVGHCSDYLPEQQNLCMLMETFEL